MDEWLLIDKCDDFHFFKDRVGIANYLDISVPEVNAIINWSRTHICYYSPSKDLYIQRLFNNRAVRPVGNTEWNRSPKNRYLIDWLGNYYISNN